MKFLRKEFMRNLLTHWRYNLLIFFELATVVLIGFVVVFNQQELSYRAGIYSSTFGDNNYYMINLTEESEAILDSDYTMQEVAAEVKNELINTPYWEGYLMYGDSFFVEFGEGGQRVLPQYFEYGYEEGETLDPSYNGQSLKAFSVSREAFDIYAMEVTEGRFFSAEDYILQEETGWSTAVILGSEYRDYYNVGDIILGYGFEPERNITVVGFLKEGTLFGSASDYQLIPLDRYMIFPIHDKMIMTDGSVWKNPDVSDGSFSGFLNIVSKEDTETVQGELDRITNAYGFPAIVCMQWGGSQIESTAIVSERNVWLITGLAILLCGIAILSMAHVLSRKTEKNMPTYAVYMLNGIRPRMIFISMAAEALLFSLLCVLPTVWINYFQFKRIDPSLLYLLLISIPVMIISLLPSGRLLMKINLDQLARRKSE